MRDADSGTGADDVTAVEGTDGTRTLVTRIGTFRWPASLESVVEDANPGCPAATKPGTRGLRWLPEAYTVARCLAADIDSDGRSVKFLCKLDGFRLDIDHHWFCGQDPCDETTRMAWLPFSLKPRVIYGVAHATPVPIRRFVAAHPSVREAIRQLLKLPTRG
jgi:hypothetical protein